jgi:murein L,D-transpeptidase YcbB/YkuD
MTRAIKRTSARPHHMPIIIGSVCALLLFAALGASIYTRPFMPPSVAQKHMEHWLIEGARHVAGEVRLRHIRNLEPFYLKRDYQPIWLDSYQLRPEALELLQLLRETAVDDWRQYGYSLETLEREMLRLSNIPEQATAIEVLLSDAFITYAQQALNNELLPDTGEADHPTMKKVVATGSQRINDEQVIELLHEALRQNRLPDLINSLSPQHTGYRALRVELERYRNLDRSSRWAALPHDLTLKAGDRHRDVPYLRWLLDQTGDLPAGALAWLIGDNKNNNPPANEWPAKNTKVDLNEAKFLFDGPLRDAVKSFQARNKLETTGALNEKTMQHLNIPPYQTAQRIALNMKRWRHLPSDLGERHIMVNMADFSMQLVKGGKAELEMKVIIGNLKRRTPVMTDIVRIIEIAPTWTVPPRIASSYLLPKLKRNPDYLNQKGFDVLTWKNGAPVHVSAEGINWKRYSSRHLPYTFVQRPGKLNALGTVKFLFPNDQSIYLHDTSQPQLFDLDKRALSSGCVRVEKPRLLAEMLLKGQDGWHRGQIDQAIDHNRTSRIRLKNPLPVHLMYWTTWVDESGKLQIRDDVYHRDLIAGAAAQASL